MLDAEAKIYSRVHGSGLAPFAVTTESSRGRRVPEIEHPYRNCYERDRDRIIHSRAFRRLEYKTQVFPNYEGDHFRTRLTHTIEVTQLARTVAGALRLQAPLSEAIALAHDLGHPPFGHVGERVLDQHMGENGGFEHNRQALRIVDRLEERYAAFPGLNLTFEVREGIAKHSSRYVRFQSQELVEFDPDRQPPIEAQLIDLVDDVTYNVHDIDDGLEAHILDIPGIIDEVSVFATFHRKVSAATPGATERQRFNETIRALLDHLVTALIEGTRQQILEHGIETLGQVRSCPERLCRLPDEVARQMSELGAFLTQRLYRSDPVAKQMAHAGEILGQLLAAYAARPELLPERHRGRFDNVGEDIAIADYVAGMTDRFVLREHRRLVGRNGKARTAASREER